MGALVGLGFGIGCLLIYSAFFLPRRRSESVRRTSAMERLLARAGMSHVSVQAFVLMSAGLGLICALVIQVASSTLPVAIAFGVIGGYLPAAVLRGRARRRQREFADVWPEAVDNLASAVRAGLSLPEALGQLAHRGPEALRPDFADFALDYQVTGRFGDCLDRLKERLADPVGDRVIEGLRVAREVGGGELGRLLRNLSGYLREELRTRSELESRQSWTVNGARLAVAAPWLVLLFLCFQSEVIQRYSSPAGVLVLAFGAAMCVIAYRLMVRIGQLPQEKRIWL